MKVRKITNKGPKKVIGKFPSLKMGRCIWWESQIERDYIYLLEFDPSVTSYKEQPLCISYFLNGKEHHYTPDFLVERSNRRQIVEVKREHQTRKEENVALFSAVGPLFFQQGYEFIIATDTAIRVQPRLENIKLFTRYARTPIDPQHQIACHELFAGKREVSLGEIVQFFTAKDLEIQVIYALLYWGILATDLMKPVELSSIVSLPQEISSAKEAS